MTTRARSATPKPESQAIRAVRSRQQEELIRLGVAGGIVLMMILPSIPSPLFGVDWWAAFASTVDILFQPILPALPLDLPGFGVGATIPALAPIQIGQWVLAGFLSFLALTFIMHLGGLYAQRTRPLNTIRTYLRVRVPMTEPGKSADAVTLLKALHGMLPASKPMQPSAPPLVLCWTARPERPIQAGVSVAGAPGLVVSIQKRLLGIQNGTKVVEVDDPFWAELQPGRVLCVADVRTVAGNTLPIAVVNRQQTLLAALLPTMAPQAGVVASSVRIMQEPIADRAWRWDVMAMLEQQQKELTPEEKGALNAKASGPSYRTGMQLFAIADDPSAGTAQLETMAAALSGTVQSIGATTQRLQAGPVQVYPAVMPAPTPLPTRQRQIGWGIGLGIALISVAILLLLHGGDRPLQWAIPPILGVLPILALATHHRRSCQADRWERMQAIRVGLLPLRNPQVIPLWWPWFGYPE